MHKFAAFLLATVSVTLIACVGFSSSQKGASSSSSSVQESSRSTVAVESSSAVSVASPVSSTSSSVAPVVSGQSVYTVYTDEVLLNGETKVLFFHAAWCPICKIADGQLQGWYPSSELSHSIYKVDYDTATALNAKYGVTYQHTFVLVDGQGNMLSKIQGPTEEQLHAFLQ